MPGYVRIRSDRVDATMREIIPGNTVLDLGCAEGYFSNFAGLLGASKVLGVDSNPKSSEIARKVARSLNLENVSFSCSSIFDISSTSKYDVVLAFALLHWFPDEIERPNFNSYDPIIEWLSLRGDQLIVEFIEKEDHTIRQQWWAGSSNVSCTEQIRKNFTRENFLQALHERFDNVKSLGNTCETRELFFAS